MQTSQQWWAKVKADAGLFTDWLLKQWRGEVTASARIRALADNYEGAEKHQKALHLIAEQEDTHATWVAELLASRGINVSALPITAAENRYWAHTLPGIVSFDTGAAVAAHAELMRLERIRVICADADAPADVRDVFNRILVDEEWHERAFKAMASPEAYAATAGNHELGKQALGLEA